MGGVRALLPTAVAILILTKLRVVVHLPRADPLVVAVDGCRLIGEHIDANEEDIPRAVCRGRDSQERS